MTEREIKLLILNVIRDIIDNNLYYKDEGEDFFTNLDETIKYLMTKYEYEN